jgi:ankyrin repeat protein
VRLLIEHGADVQAQDQNLSTPLHLASSLFQNAESVQLLIEYGADVHAQDQSHKTPLDLVPSNPWDSGLFSTYEQSDVYAQDKTPLLHPGQTSWELDETVRLLIEHGEDAQDQEPQDAFAPAIVLGGD